MLTFLYEIQIHIEILLNLSTLFEKLRVVKLKLLNTKSFNFERPDENKTMALDSSYLMDGGIHASHIDLLAFA